MAEIWLDAMQILSSTLRLATPLILAAMAGLFSERAGVVDIGLEGKMLMGAFAAAAVASATGSPWLGLFAAILAGVTMALIHGFATITHRGDQIVSGVAINILASGLTIVIGIALFKMGGQTPSLTREERFLPIDWPGADAVASVPILNLLAPLFATGFMVGMWKRFLQPENVMRMKRKNVYGSRQSRILP